MICLSYGPEMLGGGDSLCKRESCREQRCAPQLPTVSAWVPISSSSVCVQAVKRITVGFPSALEHWKLSLYQEFLSFYVS